MRTELDMTGLGTTVYGAALLAGRLVVTLESKSTGEHISLEFKGWAPRRTQAPLDECVRMYVNVAHSWDKVATIVPYRESVVVWRDQHADDQRWWTCLKVLDIARGVSEAENHQWRVIPGKNCLRCGAELTEPESIDALMGPHCRKLVSARYGVSHQKKAQAAPSQDSVRAAAAHLPAPSQQREDDRATDGMVVLQPGESLDTLHERLMQS